MSHILSFIILVVAFKYEDTLSHPLHWVNPSEHQYIPIKVLHIHVLDKQ